MIYIFLKYIIQYRKKIIEKNLRLSFPDANQAELSCIRDEYYKHLSNILIESIMLIFLSRKKIKEHYVFENVELLEEIISSGQNVSAITGHYANWEWLISVPLWSYKVKFATIFQRIKNQTINKICFKLRSKFGVICIEKNVALRKIIQLANNSPKCVTAFIADQCPSRQNIHYWIDFLHQPTPIFSGWATISRKLNSAVVYIKITEKSKHKYSVRFELITTTPQQYTEEELCKIYMKKLEDDIIQKPELWLWSHNRWKHEPPIDYHYE